MDLSGGTLVSKQDLQARLLKAFERQSVLDRQDLALLLPPLPEQAEGKRALVWEGDHTISGEWRVDWLEPFVNRKKSAAIACFGHLTVEGDLLNRSTYYTPLLFVAGDLRVRNLIKGGMPLFVLGSLLADGYIVDLIDEGMDGAYLKDSRGGLLRVGGEPWLIGMVEAAIPHDPERSSYPEMFARGLRHCLEGCPDNPVLVPGHAPVRRDPRELLVPEVFEDEYEDWPTPNEEWLWARQRAGLPVLK